MLIYVTSAIKSFPMMETNYQKVEDNCHFTGKVKSEPNSTWNLRCTIPREVSVIIHMDQMVISIW